jgi:RNA polymerase sigma-70 factor, ECF subfamily
MSELRSRGQTAQSVLLRRAQDGDEDAFRKVIEPHQRELHAHCYRMLGSVHDAEDALQGAKRVLPMDFGPATDPQIAPGVPIAETTWLEPYPDQAFGLEDGYSAPEARYERRESVEMLDTTVASVNSALQRARSAVDERVPSPSQQATLRSLGDEALRKIVDRYVEAWERCDVEAFAGMLTEEASFAMPPLARWYHTRQGIATWAALSPLSGRRRWRTLLTRANGQPALGFYAWDDDQGAYLAFALNVLTFEGGLIREVTAFVARSIEPADDESYEQWPNQATDEKRLAGTFASFGLPDRLT